MYVNILLAVNLELSLEERSPKKITVNLLKPENPTLIF